MNNAFLLASNLKLPPIFCAAFYFKIYSHRLSSTVEKKKWAREKSIFCLPYSRRAIAVVFPCGWKRFVLWCSWICIWAVKLRRLRQKDFPLEMVANRNSRGNTINLRAAGVTVIAVETAPERRNPKDTHKEKEQERKDILFSEELWKGDPSWEDILIPRIKIHHQNNQCPYFSCTLSHPHFLLSPSSVPRYFPSVQ